MRALVVIDVQNDFLPGGTLAVPDGDAVVAVANAAMASFELVVATQDWHPADHGSFASQHPGHEPGQVIELAGTRQVLWPDHCVQHGSGAAFAPGLDTAQFTRVFRKGTDPEVDSYSGFFDNARRHATGLDDFLRTQRVEEVFVLGLATDYCVKFTALDSREQGFRTRLVADGCRGVELQDGDVSAALEEMRRAGVTIVESADLSR